MLPQKRGKRKAAAPGRALEQIPNVGPSIAGDLVRLNIRTPAQLRGKNPQRLYQRLCALDGVRHDPCLLDVFCAAVHFVTTGEAKPWWFFSRLRKRARAQNAA
jgi:hypothetical protein